MPVKINPQDFSTYDVASDFQGARSSSQGGLWSLGKMMMFGRSPELPVPFGVEFAGLGASALGGFGKRGANAFRSKILQQGVLNWAAQPGRLGATGTRFAKAMAPMFRGFGAVARFAFRPALAIGTAYSFASTIGAAAQRYKRTETYANMGNLDPITSYYHRNNRARAYEAVRKSAFGMRGAFGNEAMLMHRM
jgi:hypothetical protein